LTEELDVGPRIVNISFAHGNERTIFAIANKRHIQEFTLGEVKVFLLLKKSSWEIDVLINLEGASRDAFREIVGDRTYAQRHSLKQVLVLRLGLSESTHAFAFHHLLPLVHLLAINFSGKANLRLIGRNWVNL
jgi:hypothetical protein